MRRWLFGLFMLAHGAIHLMGFASITGLALLEEVSRTPTTLFTGLEAGDSVLVAFGVLWLVTFIGFAGASIGLFARRAWWSWLAVASAVISSGLVVLWWTDAKFGLLANLVVLGGVVLARTRPREAAVG